MTNAKSVADIIEVFFKAGVDTIMCPHTKTCIPDAIREAEQRTGVKAIVVSTPSFTTNPRTLVEGFDLDEAARILDEEIKKGVTICMPHTSTTDVMLDKCTRQVRRMDVLCRMIRERNMVPGLSTHIPETVVFADESGLDVETYIQPFNLMGYLMQLEVDWVGRIIQKANKPVMTIKTMGGRADPAVSGADLHLERHPRLRHGHRGHDGAGRSSRVNRLVAGSPGTSAQSVAPPDHALEVHPAESIARVHRGRSLPTSTTCWPRSHRRRSSPSTAPRRGSGERTKEMNVTDEKTTEAAVTFPSAEHLAWADAEIGVIIHQDLETYDPSYQVHKGTLPQASVFNPTALDTDQWLATAKAAGARYAVLVAKHCSGFCLWPTAAIDFSVRQSPWKSGQGDVVADFIASCRKHDVQPGLYYSTSFNGYLQIGQGGRPLSGRPEDLRRYNDIVVQQLTELWTHYGPLFEIWFDGGCAPAGGRRTATAGSDRPATASRRVLPGTGRRQEPALDRQRAG